MSRFRYWTEAQPLRRLMPGNAGERPMPLLLSQRKRIAMFKLIEGMPTGVMAIEAIGEVTHEDYRDTLIPQAEAMIGKGPIKMIYIVGKDFTLLQA